MCFKSDNKMWAADLEMSSGREQATRQSRLVGLCTGYR